MGRCSSLDLRERLLLEIEQGMTCRAAARLLGVAPSTAIRLVHRKRRTGSLAPERQGRPIGSGRLDPYLATLTGWIEADDRVTMTELSARLLAECDVKAHPVSLARLLVRHGLSVKRRGGRPPRSR